MTQKPLLVPSPLLLLLPWLAAHLLPLHRLPIQQGAPAARPLQADAPRQGHQQYQQLHQWQPEEPRVLQCHPIEVL